MSNEIEFQKATTRVKNDMIRAYIERSSPDKISTAVRVANEMYDTMSVADIMEFSNEIQAGKELVYSATYGDFYVE